MDTRHYRYWKLDPASFLWLHPSNVETLLVSEAFEHLLTHFYDTAEVDDSLIVYQPMDFQVGLGYPELA